MLEDRTCLSVFSKTIEWIWITFGIADLH